ncbi:Small integral membrane protein [Desulfonispora thiosulfatigenes DSM 11270]|uniref:Small integral membrane protein n=1 Tax=Desulfonispora thiosulfatigenes DSM 11270 TaxID=656914 RepID=A0A1W1VP70_DESTI|nr:DUF2273 domain-containing protein [Desulfonispora thiosulfatigenes]SMB94861.1 Small integral membrane protein [Desulfonispora thiosulfatigenes DSM 11270]
MLEKILDEVLTHHKGKFFGILIGLLFSVLVISVGLLETIFIAVCIYIGFVVGKRVDQNESFYSIIDKVFRERH